MHPIQEPASTGEDSPPATPLLASSGTGLSQHLAQLPQLNSAQLRTEWRRLFRSQPPTLSRDLLVRALAYRLQE